MYFFPTLFLPKAKRSLGISSQGLKNRLYSKCTVNVNSGVAPSLNFLRPNWNSRARARTHMIKHSPTLPLRCTCRRLFYVASTGYWESDILRLAWSSHAWHVTPALIDWVGYGTGNMLWWDPRYLCSRAVQVHNIDRVKHFQFPFNAGLGNVSATVCSTFLVGASHACGVCHMHHVQYTCPSDLHHDCN